MLNPCKKFCKVLVKSGSIKHFIGFLVTLQDWTAYISCQGNLVE